MADHTNFRDLSEEKPQFTYQATELEGVELILEFSNPYKTLASIEELTETFAKNYKEIVDQTERYPSIIVAANGGLLPTLFMLIHLQRAGVNIEQLDFVIFDHQKVAYNKEDITTMNLQSFFVAEDMIDKGHTLEDIYSAFFQKIIHMHVLSSKVSKPAKYIHINNGVIFPDEWILCSYALNSGWTDDMDNKELAAQIKVAERLAGKAFISKDPNAKQRVLENPQPYLKLLNEVNIFNLDEGHKYKFIEESMFQIELAEDVNQKMNIFINAVKYIIQFGVS